MKKQFFALLIGIVSSNLHAHDLSLVYSDGVKAQDKAVLEKVFSEVSDLLPASMKAKMPKDITVNVTALTSHKNIPDEVCGKVEGKFIYGQYNHYKNILTINAPVVAELARGRENSKRINCQHKSLYDQAVATMIHELTHAYDNNNGRISNSIEYIRRAGFKKGLLKVKNKNVAAMRSADPYELVNIAESFAVNMEYFTMDPEFYCRKPSMFNFFRQHFNTDPFPGRNCQVSKTVMMSTPASGYIPVELDLNRIYRIDYLVASPGKGISSGFGHSMFRIVMCAPERKDELSGRIVPATPMGKKCVEDKMYHIVVSYRANVEDATLNLVKGLVGGYPSMLYILNLSDVLDEYNRDELRDVVAYPLMLSVKEREDFILKVIEEHWNYRGDYKFINTNCATESYDLLKAALERSQLNQKSSVSPNGVLEDLDQLNFLSVKSEEIESFKAKTDQMVLAYKSAYGYKMKSESADKKAVQKFIYSSSVENRLSQFKKFQAAKISEGEMNTQVSLLKERLVAASSFSVMEQQILRTLGMQYKKQAAEMFMSSKDERILEVVKETESMLKSSFTDLSKNGYGIPLADELATKDDLTNKSQDSLEALAKAEKLLREVMPAEFAVLESINKNIVTFNMYSLQVRKEFRAKLDEYVKRVLTNLSHEDFSRGVMESAANGNKTSLDKVRELLGKDLVTEKEILDAKLRKMIQETL